MTTTSDAALLEQLAPTGVLRAAINMSNFLLVRGEDNNGLPFGVSPDMAKAIADKLGVGLKLIKYKGPGDIADDALTHSWDIANIAAEPERAKTIFFAPAYCEIQATYLLQANSVIKNIADVDKPGNRIVAKGRAAFELWLRDNLEYGEIVATSSHDESFKVFVDNDYEVLAGLRPRLLEDHASLPGSILMEESFTAIKQSIGCMPEKPHAQEFLTDFVHQAIQSGFVESRIRHHGVVAKLSVAPLLDSE